MKGECATTEVTTVTTDLTAFLAEMKSGLSDFTYNNLSLILLAGLSLSVGPAIFWFGFRWIKGKVSKAFFKGKL